MAFGLGKKIPKQGTSSGVHTQQSRTGDSNGRASGAVSTPGLGKDHAKNVNQHVAGKGGSGTTSAGGPKPFKG